MGVIELVVEKEHTGHHSKGNKKIWVFSIISVILFASAIVIFAIPFPYSATEEYTEKEPYAAVEYYMVKEPYTVQEPYTDQVPYVTQECEIEIPTGVVGLVVGVLDLITGNEPFQDSYEVTKYRATIKYRTVTKYKDVQKSREVTRYRDVTKTRSVTKYAALFQQWTGKVKWYYKVD